MKGLRKIVPTVSLGLCLALIAFLVASALFTSTYSKEANARSLFAFKAQASEQSTLFTSNVLEGLVEIVDSDSREKADIISLTGIILQSRRLSEFVVIIQSRLSSSGRTASLLPIFLRQLII